MTETYLITYLTSARELQRLQTRAPSREGPLILANPDFNYTESDENASPPKSALATNFKSSSNVYAPLVGTDEEATQIAKILPEAKVLRGAGATEKALKQAHSPSVLHVATHAFFPKTVPWGSNSNVTKINGQEVFKPSIVNVKLDFPRTTTTIQNISSQSQTGIVLAGANKRKLASANDGILTAFELSGLDLAGTRLVVLSACETAIGDVDASNGVFGLRRALVLAGAESQIMSLWKVDDKATREMMTSFYRGLRTGQGISEALREVRLDMLRSKKYSHPYFWASFIQSGSWEGVGRLN